MERLSSAVLLAVVCAACGPSQDRASDIELKAAIDRLRNGSSHDWAQRQLDIHAVEEVQARTPAGIDAKAACVTAYRDLAAAEEAVSDAERSLKMAQALHTQPSVTDLEYVARADRLLQKAKEAMPACDEAAAKLAVAAR